MTVAVESSTSFLSAVRRVPFAIRAPCIWLLRNRLLTARDSRHYWKTVSLSGPIFLFGQNCIGNSHFDLVRDANIDIGRLADLDMFNTAVGTLPLGVTLASPCHSSIILLFWTCDTLSTLHGISTFCGSLSHRAYLTFRRYTRPPLCTADRMGCFLPTPNALAFVCLGYG